MNEIRVSQDLKVFGRKPKGHEISDISSRIGYNIKRLNRDNMKYFAKDVGSNGRTFCPATFYNGRRKAENFEQAQMFVLDFDGSLPLEEVFGRSERHNLPILFVYSTFRSVDNNRFRVVFLNDVSVTGRQVAEMMLDALHTIFPEADKQCRDISRMYFGGKRLLYYDETMPEIDIYSLAKSLSMYMRDVHGSTHYKSNLKKFARVHGISLTKNSFLDISVTESSVSSAGSVSSSNNARSLYDARSPYGDNDSCSVNGSNSPNGLNLSQCKFLPSSIILNKHIGENLPSVQYTIGHGNDRSIGNRNNSNNNNTTDSVARSGTGNGDNENDKTSGADRTGRPRRSPFRSDILPDISKSCRLFRDFETHERRLSKAELFGIATNIVQVESGISRFKSILTHNPHYHNMDYSYWDYNLNYEKKQGYNPMSCHLFCPYKDKCRHGTNILATVTKAKPRTMERLAYYVEEYHDIESVAEDVRQKILSAVYAIENKWYIIKAQTAIGKTTIYLDIMKDHNGRMLIAVSTNILKNQVYEDALKLGIKVMKTPSLDEIKGEMPGEVWEHISRLYATGNHKAVYPYIYKLANEQGTECLKDHLKQMDEFRDFDGHVITTHRRMIYMDDNTFSKYDVVLVDEDIIHKSVIPDQVAITVRDLKKTLKRTLKSSGSLNRGHHCGNDNDFRLIRKIRQALKAIETERFFELPGFVWEDEKVKDSNKNNQSDSEAADGTSTLIDVPSFCMATHFCYRKASSEENLYEDTLVFLKLPRFKDAKYIMLSATSDKTICEYYFGAENVVFHECKKAKYKGTLNQYYERTMSRDYIKRNPGIIEKIKKFTGVRNTITFKMLGLSPRYFGNTEGCNDMAGQDIDVIGTNHHPDFIYKLFAFTLGLDFDHGARPNPHCEIVRNGYKCRINTFVEEVLQNVHLWLVESDLEQAVGRARLLRNDCTVNLFSNFPLAQANMKSWEHEHWA